MSLHADTMAAIIKAYGGSTYIEDCDHHAADAELAVMAAEHSRRIEVAVARLMGIRTSLQSGHPVDCRRLCNETLATISDLLPLLPADAAKKWAEKQEQSA